MAASPAPEGTLDAVQRIAKEAGAASVAADAAALAARLAEGRFFVACLGQFKRGKSTLLNALVGERALPTGVVPVTSAVTILRPAPSPCARVILASGETAAIEVGALAEYVTEEHNPENAKGVAAVEIGLPSPLLASGTCLVDTPGIGSVFAGNTAVTRRFIPHIDAALVVIGTDPPISGDELAMIEEVARETPEIIVVLAKADREEPAALAEARAFAERVLAARIGHPVGRIFEVSAAEQLAVGPTRDFGALVEALEGLAATSGAALVERALLRGQHRLVERLLADLESRSASSFGRGRSPSAGSQRCGPSSPAPSGRSAIWRRCSRRSRIAWPGPSSRRGRASSIAAVTPRSATSRPPSARGPTRRRSTRAAAPQSSPRRSRSSGSRPGRRRSSLPPSSSTGGRCSASWSW
jgi:GTP-binding protein EngB required for normal cell division